MINSEINKKSFFWQLFDLYSTIPKPIHCLDLRLSKHQRRTRINLLLPIVNATHLQSFEIKLFLPRMIFLEKPGDVTIQLSHFIYSIILCWTVSNFSVSDCSSVFLWYYSINVFFNNFSKQKPLLKGITFLFLFSILFDVY